MKEKEFLKWTKYRKIGQLKYTLLWGLYYIILLNIIVSVGNVLRHKFTFEISQITFGIIIGGACGALIGTSIWKNSEARYIKYLNKQDKS